MEYQNPQPGAGLERQQGAGQQASSPVPDPFPGLAAR